VQRDLGGRGAPLAQDLRRAPVQPRALSVGERLEDGRAQQRVGVRGGAHHEQPGGGEPRQRASQGAAVQAGERGEILDARPVAEHSCGLRDAGVLGAEAGEAPGGDRAHAPRGERGELLGLLVAAAQPLRRRLAREDRQQQRVAGGGVPRGVAEARRDRAGERRFEERPGGPGAERRRLDPLGRRQREEHVEQLGVRPGLVGAQRPGEEDRQPLDPAGEQLEHPQRRDVGPVQVVDAQHDRALVGEVRDEPVQPAEHPVLGLVGQRHAAVEQRRCAARRAGEEPRAFGARATVHHRLEELVDEAEAEPAIQLGGAGAEHERVVLAREIADHVEQRRLAEPRRAHDELHRPVVVPARPAESAAQRRDRRVALQQSLARHRTGS
jgi:hypothetical protein